MPSPQLPENIADHEFLHDTPLKTHRAVSAYPPEPARSRALRPPDLAWVEHSLSTMSLEEKVGQLFISTGTKHGVAEEQIARCHVGGFVFMGNGQLAQDIANRVNELQKASPFPLWFAIDSEAGLGARVADATVFPTLMAFGASRRAKFSELCGVITARESRALGLHITFGPVVDVNTEPFNPIISTRSYGDDPSVITEMARGYVAGARSEGVLATLKHYPGHGASQGDSHSSLPTIEISPDELELHLRPYRELIASGHADMVMTAHLWFPCIHPGNPWPATLSTWFNDKLLRKQMGFDGLIVSDAFDMLGLALAVPEARDRGVVGLEAGLDIILGESNDALPLVRQGILDAVRSGRLPEARVDQSVRRILKAKSSAWLPEQRFVDPDAWRRVLDHPKHREVVAELADASCTQLRSPSDGTPSHIQQDVRLLVLKLQASQRIFYRYDLKVFTERLASLFPESEIRAVGRPVTAEEEAEIIASLPAFDEILVMCSDWTRIASDTQQRFLERLSSLGTPLNLVLFGAPYAAEQCNGIHRAWCAYSTAPECQSTMAEVIAGVRDPVGRVPVHLG